MPDTEQDRNSKGQTASLARGNHQNRDAQARCGSLHKSILDAGWGSFVQICSIKAAWTGRTLIKVDPAFISQVYSGCGQVRKKDLSERWHSCECGTELDRDVNAAMNILERGRRQRGTTCLEAPSLLAGEHFTVHVPTALVSLGPRCWAFQPASGSGRSTHPAHTRPCWP